MGAAALKLLPRDSTLEGLANCKSSERKLQDDALRGGNLSESAPEFEGRARSSGRKLQDDSQRGGNLSDAPFQPPAGRRPRPTPAAVRGRGPGSGILKIWRNEARSCTSRRGEAPCRSLRSWKSRVHHSRLKNNRRKGGTGLSHATATI